MQQEIVSQDLFHEHPLCRIPAPAAEGDCWNNWCCGCYRYFLDGEAAYGCSLKCGFPDVLHKECLEMPREIRHPLHPSHTLTLQHNLSSVASCAVCEGSLGGMLYRCNAGCEVQIHMECAGSFEIVAADEDERMEHPSHPHHLLKKILRRCSFQCDACGITTDTNSSYICTVCNYWIHEKCALLPLSNSFPSHHHHSLSLSFNPPYEYAKYEFDCAICSGPLPLRRWVYHCYLCKYIVHINCANKKPSTEKKLGDDEKGITKSPVDDIYGEMIRGFIKRERGGIVTSYDNSRTYKFIKHSHSLRFTTFSNWLPSSSSHDHNEEEEEEEEEEDDDDDDDDGIPLRCDGCTLPIDEKNGYNEKGYMSCDECKYFLHLSCFNLPLHLPSSPLHHRKDHNLTLRNAGKLRKWARCNICRGYTNGLFYGCTKCAFRLDIKCASLPNTVKHAAHPRHNHLELITCNHESGFCDLCYITIVHGMILYKCDGCRFSVCGECVLLPAHNKHRLERHCMPLTYNAYVNRLGDFYCSSCELKMNPKERMYHCRDCDQSFHLECFPATSGRFRNINFGRQQYVIPKVHNLDHALRFLIITKKKQCDLCHQERYDKPGFECVSCNFVMCLLPCGRKHEHDIKAI